MLSFKEEDILERSNKKLKNSIVHEENNQPCAHTIPTMPVGLPRPQVPYKDSLVGHIPSAYKKVFLKVLQWIKI